MAHTLKSAVIGLGQIGQGYDFDWPDDSKVLTHASGFHYHPSFELTGGVDPDPANRKRFEKKFEIPAYVTVEALYAHQSPQIVSIAVPTPLHYCVFKEVIRYQPLAVICEKPIAETVKQATEMILLAEKSQCALLVNYMRRFDPGVVALKNSIKNGEFGKFLKGTVWYSKGLLNNGSHFLNLLEFILGDVGEITPIQNFNTKRIDDYAPDFIVEFDGTSVYFLSASKAGYSYNEMYLIGSHGSIHYANGGNEIKARYAEAHPEYPGYKILTPRSKMIETDLQRYQWHTLERLKNHLHDGERIIADGSSALRTLKIIQDLYINVSTGELNE